VRPFTIFVNKLLDGLLVGAEVGVYAGANAQSLLDNTLTKTLYLIDPYEMYESYEFEGAKAQLYLSLEEAEREAHKRLAKYHNRVVWLQEKFGDVSKMPPLDYVYIDGNHSFDFVKVDVEQACKFVRDGGVVGGHNYCWSGSPDVKRFVDEFVKVHGLRLFIVPDDWWFIASARARGPMAPATAG